MTPLFRVVGSGYFVCFQEGVWWQHVEAETWIHVELRAGSQLELTGKYFHDQEIH